MTRILILTALMLAWAVPGLASRVPQKHQIETPKNNRVLKRLRTDLGQMLFGKAIVRAAVKQLGQADIWSGGTDVKKGFDGSAYVWFIFSRVGVKMPRSAVQQMRGGIVIEKASMLPGDLVFFASRSSPSGFHVGIYTGDGAFLHSTGAGKIIRQDRLDSKRWKRKFHVVRRWLPKHAANPQK